MVKWLVFSVTSPYARGMEPQIMAVLRPVYVSPFHVNVTAMQKGLLHQVCGRHTVHTLYIDTFNYGK